MSEGVCEAPTFMEWSTMVVPTYPEDGSHALQVCQHHHQVVRVGHFVGLSETGRTMEVWKNMVLATAPADSAETFTVPLRTARSMVPSRWRAVARPSTRARCSSAQNRVMGTNSTKPLAKPRILLTFKLTSLLEM